MFSPSFPECSTVLRDIFAPTGSKGFLLGLLMFCQIMSTCCQFRALCNQVIVLRCLEALTKHEPFPWSNLHAKRGVMVLQAIWVIPVVSTIQSNVTWKSIMVSYHEHKHLGLNNPLRLRCGAFMRGAVVPH